MSNTPIHVISLFKVLLPVSGKSLFYYLFLSLFLDDQFHEKQNQAVLAHFLGCSCISLLFLSWYDRYQIKFIIYFSCAAFAARASCATLTTHASCATFTTRTLRTAFAARASCATFTTRTLRTAFAARVFCATFTARTLCTAFTARVFCTAFTTCAIRTAWRSNNCPTAWFQILRDRHLSIIKTIKSTLSLLLISSIDSSAEIIIVYSIPAVHCTSFK